MKSIAHGKFDSKDLDRELRDIIAAIKELQTGSLITPVSSSLSTSSTTSISSAYEIRRNIVSITGGIDNVIVFTTPMPVDTYTLPQPRCWSTDSGIYTDVGFVISAKTIYGFTINPVENATCEYIAFY